MARTSESDPIDKFRFEVTFLRDSPSLGGGIGEAVLFNIEEAIKGSGLQKKDIGSLAGNPQIGNKNFNRTGFSEVSSPRITTTEINYRENLHAPAPSKQAGLLRYEPITLRRGATRDVALYSWAKLTNNEVTSINIFSAALAGFSIPPFQRPDYRIDLIVSYKNRDGTYAKHILLFNCFPVGFRGGDDFNALQDAKLIEEVTITFEAMFETVADSIEQALKNLQDESLQALADSTVYGALSKVLD